MTHHSNGIIDRLILTIFYLMMLLMPIMILPYGMHTSSRYVLFTVTSALLLPLLFIKISRINKVIYVKPIYPFLIAVCVSTIFSVNKFIALFGIYRIREGLVTFILYLTIFLTIITITKLKQQLLDVSIYLSIGLFLNNLIGFYDIIFNNYGAGIRFGSRISTTFGDPNLLAGFIILALPLSISGLELTNNTRIRSMLVLNALLTLLILVFSGSRSAIISLLFASLFIAVYSINIRMKLLLITLSLSSLIFINPFLLSRFTTIGTELLNRISGAKGALYYFTANPLFGTGPDTFRLFTNDFGGFGGAHSGLLHMAQNIGLFGVVSFLYILIFILWCGLRVVNKQRSNPVLYCLTSILAFCVFFLFNYTSAVINAFLWINMALVICLYNIENIDILDNIKMPKLNALLPVVSIISCLLILLVIRIPIGGIYYQQALIDEEAGRYIEALSKYGMAARMVPDDEFSLGRLGSLSLELSKEGYTNYLPVAKESFEQINNNISPNNPDILNVLKEIQDIEKNNQF